ncbi:BatA domain-containing protein [Terrimonas sp. NA20]|uniref:BatA domain-containing protein n=1 Tax=Terrimonas ginsenosidimutans TaxID=2908004 RepID=A0ABS9L013_9BACT|nr:BatA domain-containing protein [Terrimonas ginsenosidimutans]MCG2617969.1 BatA domain-containing protein [Terrimonas ginsenosidimutans]
MFQLFNPIALFASAAVIIPVLIHLWNKRKGQTLKVGSISLLTENAKTTSRNFRITEWPLLLLRCLLIILVAALLAQPYWNNQQQKNKAGWIIINEHELATAYQQQQYLIDSLLKKGFELRNLSPQINTLTLSDTGKYEQNQPAVQNYWSYIRYLDAALPPKFPVYIISDLSAAHFAGKRPSAQLELYWISINRPLKADTITVDTYVDADGQSMALNKISSGTGSYFENVATNSSTQINKSRTINVSIYAGANSTDAKYLSAALSAIASYTGRNILINHSGDTASKQAIFWLQDSEPGEKIMNTLAAGGTIVRYEHTDSSLVKKSSTANNGSSILDGKDQDLFYQYASAGSKGLAVWKLANGRNILSEETIAGKHIIYFNSRFNPQWTDIVWNESLARLLLPIVLASPAYTGKDLRQISLEQSMPRHVDKKQNGITADAGFLNKTDLSFLLWIAVFAVFTLERIIAHHQLKQKNG